LPPGANAQASRSTQLVRIDEVLRLRSSGVNRLNPVLSSDGYLREIVVEEATLSLFEYSSIAAFDHRPG